MDLDRALVVRGEGRYKTGGSGYAEVQLGWVVSNVAEQGQPLNLLRKSGRTAVAKREDPLPKRLA